MSQYPYPADEFDSHSDDGPTPVGVHRAPVPASRGWLPLLAIIVIVPLLAWGAVALLGSRAGDKSEVEAGPAESVAAEDPGAATPEPEATPEETAEPTEEPTEEPATADLTTGVTIHNGTTTNGLAARTSDRLANAGYTAVTVSPGSYEEVEPTLSTVYYSAPEHAATAQAVADLLGITNVVENPESDQLTVILRDDFVE